MVLSIFKNKKEDFFKKYPAICCTTSRDSENFPKKKDFPQNCLSFERILPKFPNCFRLGSPGVSTQLSLLRKESSQKQLYMNLVNNVRQFLYFSQNFNHFKTFLKTTKTWWILIDLCVFANFGKILLKIFNHKYLHNYAYRGNEL